MKKIVIILLLIFTTIAAKSQNLQDVLYLNNGSILRGTLIEQVPKIKFRTVDGSIWVFEQNDVDKITSEPTESNNNNSPISQQTYLNDGKEITQNHSGYTDLSSGLRIFADVFYQQKTSDYTCSVFGFSVAFDWQLTPNFAVGVGLADQAYFDYYYYGTYSSVPEYYQQMPIFTELRYDFLPSKISPFANFRIGYALAADDEFHDYSGFYLNPSVGVRLSKFSLSVGADLVKLNDPWIFLKGNTEEQVNWQSSIMFKLSYEWGGRR